MAGGGSGGDAGGIAQAGATSSGGASGVGGTGGTGAAGGAAGTSSSGGASGRGGQGGSGGNGGAFAGAAGEGQGGSGGDATNGGEAGAAGSSKAGFFESFEDETLDPWASGPEGDSAITDEAAADGTSRSLRVPGEVYYYAGPNVTFEPIAASSVSFWVRFTGAEPSFNGVAHFALSADADATDELLQIWAAPAGFIIDGALPDSTVTPGGGVPEPDTWYLLELDIDWPTRAVTLSVNGELALENELHPNGDSIQRIDLFTVEPAASYFDEIAIAP